MRPESQGGAVIDIVLGKDVVRMPSWVVDLESFRRWLDAEDVPEKVDISYLEDEVRVDMSKEQVFSHVLVKTEFAVVLGGMVKAGLEGLYFIDGVRVSNIQANFSVRSDGVFASHASLESKRVRVTIGEVGFLELEGSPDMMLEVVSPSSVDKDTKVLRQAYREGGIREYWLVDAREEPLSFDILRHATGKGRGYTATRKQQGWLKSEVFGKSFRLQQRTTALGHPDYTLEAR
jgi:hypothetical protein